MPVGIEERNDPHLAVIQKRGHFRIAAIVFRQMDQNLHTDFRGDWFSGMVFAHKVKSRFVLFLRHVGRNLDGPEVMIEPSVIWNGLAIDAAPSAPDGGNLHQIGINGLQLHQFAHHLIIVPVAGNISTRSKGLPQLSFRLGHIPGAVLQF